ncbi:PREDICTED: mucin-1 isoform X7 [Rhinopithecus bieti]|uniref:Mucin 1, cell surface associated n=2 Tax=Rhinopithecus TaxID=542827 RepID=A0A2K6L729_RHIBE|nr:PREDICTED: mucin-1 isoform X7 [Rhinopithecus bieti]
MTPGTQSPFFLLLILTVLTVVTGSGHTSSTPGGEKETSATQRSSMPISTKNAIPAPTTTNSCRETFLNCFCRFINKGIFWASPILSSVRDVPFPFSAQSGAGVPGWGIALLVLVCVLVVLAIVYFIALAVCQCRQKNYRQLDIFPARDAYHPMSEYPTYHTHGRYVPPGSTNRSPYEEVSAGNGGSSLSYTNPAVAATSANL